MGSAGALSPEARQAVAELATSAAAFAVSVGVGTGPIVQSGANALAADLPAAELGDADPIRELAGQCLDGLALVARLESCLAAVKVRLAADFVAAGEAIADPDGSARDVTVREMSTVAEVACVLTIGERSAATLISQSLELTRRLPLTLAALEAGLVSWQQARTLVDEAVDLDAAAAAGLEAHFLGPYFPALTPQAPAHGSLAGELVPGRLRSRVRAWRERHHRESIEVRHARGEADRRVEFVPDRDGMAWLSAYLPADTASGIWERTTAAARSLQCPGESRTLPQLRADLAATWLLTCAGTPPGGPGQDSIIREAGSGQAGSVDGGCVNAGLPETGVPTPRAQVLVTVPVFSLLGVTEEPAVLDGYGPIPPSMARRLIAEGADSFYRVLVDPRDGAPLEIGRTSYRLTKPLRQWLRLRDGKCPFPGCSNASLDNDADHLLAWADGGTTGISNLGQPCRKHHRLKHATAWQPTAAGKTQSPGWTSPTGRTYASEPQDWEPPHDVPPDLQPDHLHRQVSALDGVTVGDAGSCGGPPDWRWTAVRRTFPQSLRHCA